MEPWNGYTLDDARSNPNNWAQNPDGSWTYVGGHAAIGGDPTIPPSTYGYGGYDPLSAADYLYAPGPPPQPPYDPLSSSKYLYEAQPAPVPPAPAPGSAPAPPPTTTAAPAPPPPVAAALNAAATSVPAPLPPAPIPSDRRTTTVYGDAAAPTLSGGWVAAPSTWTPPLPEPAEGNRWDDPLFHFYLRTLQASQPDRVRLIRGLPGSALTARPLGAPGWRPDAGGIPPVPPPPARPPPPLPPLLPMDRGQDTPSHVQAPDGITQLVRRVR
jgi:hypothetical protein